MASNDQVIEHLKEKEGENKESDESNPYCQNHELERDPDSTLLLLATRAFKEWQKHSAITDAMIWGAGITNAVKSHNDFTSLLSPHGLQRQVVVSTSRPQFKLVRRSVTIPLKLAKKYRIGTGPIRIRLFIKGDRETWTDADEEECFTSAWCDLPKKYKIRIEKEHVQGGGRRGAFGINQVRGGKAKKAATELLTGLDEMVAANRKMRSMRVVMSYVKTQRSIDEG